jgi:hypothetical protein
MTKIDTSEDSIAGGASGAIEIEISEPLDVTNYISDAAFNNDESGKSISFSPPIVRDIPLPATTKQEIEDWIAQKREGSRSGIAITVIVFFGIFLLVELLLIGLGTFYPPANLDLLKDTLPLLSSSLTSIVTIVLVFYFKEK